MRKRIISKNTLINIEDFAKEIERRIQVKKELVYITSRLEKVSFSEAKKSIKWDCIKREVNRLETTI